MTLSISFYNGIKYTKDDFIKRDQDFFGNGVVKAEHFPYTLASTPGMTIQIGTGVAWVDGYRIENDAPITFTLQPPGDQPRIDIVQIGHDDFHACAVLEVKTGVTGHTESIPEADPKFVELYAIYVNPGVVGIKAEDVVKVASLVPLQVSGTQISIEGAVPSSEKGQPYGVATLDSMSLVLRSQLPISTAAAIGGVRIGSGITIQEDGTISVSPYIPPATSASTDVMQTWSAAQTFANGLTVQKESAALSFDSLRANESKIQWNANATKDEGLEFHVDGVMAMVIGSDKSLTGINKLTTARNTLDDGMTGQAVFAGLVTATGGIAVPNGQNISVNGKSVLTTADKAIANGVATLDDRGKVVTSQLPAMNYASLGVSDTDVNFVKALNFALDTRTRNLTYTNNLLTQVQELSGQAIVKTTTLNYNPDGTLANIVETADGRTVTTTLSYSVDGTLSSIAKAVN